MRRSVFKLLSTMTDKQRRLVDRIDQRVTSFMSKTGHIVEEWIIAVLFIWFGLLKISGNFSASSIIAKCIYLFDPQIMVPFLGIWEVAIGLFLIFPGLQRFAVLLLALRMPGTLLALILKYEQCFDTWILFPTIQGQYLLKEFTLLGAALVVGGTARSDPYLDS